jgi:Rieske Fe-S protein
MERSTFLKTCGFACLSGGFLISALEGCAGSKMIAGTIDNSNLVVPASVFKKENGSYFTEYSALLMRCTHQGTELQVFGDRLECPAHGSQFSDTGQVKNGPADTNLRSFPVTNQNNQLLISLK